MSRPHDLPPLDNATGAKLFCLIWGLFFLYQVLTLFQN